MAATDEPPADQARRDTRVEQAMSLEFPRLEATSMAADAAVMLWTKGWLPVPVLDGDGRLLGVVSDRDVVRAVAQGRDPWRTAASEIATMDLPIVGPETMLSEAGKALAACTYGFVLVVDDHERVLGVLTATDVEGQALIAAEFGAAAAPVVTEISPNDTMYTGSWSAYAYAGLTALGCIRGVLDKHKRPPPSRILDLPCGHGRELRFLKVAYPHAQFGASDLDRDGVDFCARVFGSEPIYSHEDPAEVTFGERYDLAWCGSLFTHLSAERWPGFLDLFARALVPGGLLLFTTNGYLPPDVLLGLGVEPAKAEQMLDDFRQKHFGYADWGNGSWGLSLARPRWVKEQIERSPLDLVSYERWAWKPPFPAQDVLVCAVPDG